MVLASGDRAALGRALEALLPAARDFGALVNVAWPGAADVGLLAAAAADGITVLQLDEGLSLAERRRESVARCAVDVIMVTGEAQALREPWSEVLAIRCGLVRHSEGLRSPIDWRGVLAALGVRGESDGS